MPRKDIAEHLAEVVSAFKEGLGGSLVSIVLFGSRARGDARVESDWDVLLVARHLSQGTLERHFGLKRMLPENWRGRIALLARTPKEFEARLPALYLDIALDGIVIYDTEGYMERKLGHVRLLIEQKGLRREQVDREMAWRWDRFPGPDWSLEWDATR